MRTMIRMASMISETSSSRARPTFSRSTTTPSNCKAGLKTPQTPKRRRACSPSCALTSTEPPTRMELTMADQPEFQAYTVVKREGQDDFWINIGAAFAHKDGDGFN